MVGNRASNGSFIGAAMCGASLCHVGPSMLAPYIPEIEEWLAAAPHLSAVDLLSRLEAHAPGRFGGHQLRTAQRLVNNWRSKAARQLISSAEITLSIDPRSVPEVLGPTGAFA